VTEDALMSATLSRPVDALRRWGARGTVLGTATLVGALFLVLAGLFFAVQGRAPIAMFRAMAEGAFGSGYALSETLVKTTPVLLCALATVLPARLGLVSVGAEGQLFMGALGGTAFVLRMGDRWGILTLPAMLAAAAVGGAAWGALAGALRARWRVNETISTLLLNYISPLFVEYLVYGPWKDPSSLGWPSTVGFPSAARLPTFFGTRAHLGLVIGVALVLGTHAALARTRWGLFLELMKSSRALAARAGLHFGRATVAVMALGGAAAGLAGMAQAAGVEGRLQSGVAAGAGYGGFLVAWLARGSLLRVLPLALVVGALDGAGDNLQLFADLPSASSLVLEGLLFTAALVAGGMGARVGPSSTEAR
jgi:ABC-type uncharacterized transport system permease subunit